MANVFAYMDYRAYLKDAFDEMKGARHGFSHRVFARSAGFRSSNYLLLIMQGKRNLSSEGILKVAKALKLRKGEAAFFENLVRFDQAKSDAERNLYYERIAGTREYADAHRLEKGQFEYYSNWYTPVIREMVLLEEFEEDPAWIARQLTPPITPREAREALELLLDIGLIVRDDAGRLCQGKAHIASGDEVASLALTNFQREMIERAASSIDETSHGLREIGSVTFAVSQEKLAEAKRMIRAFRTKLSGFLAEESQADAVYQFNVQLFNVSNVEKGSRGGGNYGGGKE